MSDSSSNSGKSEEREGYSAPLPPPPPSATTGLAAGEEDGGIVPPHGDGGAEEGEQNALAKCTMEEEQDDKQKPERNKDANLFQLLLKKNYMVLFPEKETRLRTPMIMLAMCALLPLLAIFGKWLSEYDSGSGGSGGGDTENTGMMKLVLKCFIGPLLYSLGPLLFRLTFLAYPAWYIAVALDDLVTERVQKLRFALELFGASKWQYWFSWQVSWLLTFLGSAFITSLGWTFWSASNWVNPEIGIFDALGGGGVLPVFLRFLSLVLAMVLQQVMLFQVIAFVSCCLPKLERKFLVSSALIS